MRLKALRALLIVSLLLSACKNKKVLIPETVTVPQKTLTTPNISLNTLFKNDSLVFIDTNKVVVILKRDTVNKTIQVKAKCPEERVITRTEVVTVEKPVYKTNWLALFLLLFLGFIFGVAGYYILTTKNK